MMRRIWAAALAAAMATPLAAWAQSDAGDGCPASATRPWVDDGVVEAYAVGANCKRAALLIVLRDATGELLYASAHHPADLFGFDSADTPERMTTALEEWVVGAGDSFDRASELPEWAEGDDDGVIGGEFPFYAEAWVDADLYGRIRTENGPLFCYVQGMESMACIARYPEEYGPWVMVGVQSFPG